MINPVELSFCIPTYNRAQSTRRLVTDILQCDDPSIEVVVLDNGSTDDTLSTLRAIKDERLNIYSNGKNKGVLYNVLHVLNRGRGSYVVFSTDKDHVDPNAIRKFKTFLLRHPTLACGYCEYSSRSENEFELYPKGFQAVKKIGYIGHHPTGYFFKNELLKSISMTERFSDYDFVGHFPFEFVFAELCLIGDGAIYHKPLFTSETADVAAKQKSFGTNASVEEAFFSPQGRLKLAINFSKHIDTLPLVQKDKDALMVDRFTQGLIAATEGYRSIMKNDKLCIHYHIKSRSVSGKEMLEIAVNFYLKFIKEVVDVPDRTSLSKFKFKTYIFTRLFKKLLQRIIK